MSSDPKGPVTKESSADFYRRLTAADVAHAAKLPLEIAWADEPVVVRLVLDFQGLTFLRDCLLTADPKDGATGEVDAVWARVYDLLEEAQE